MDKKRIDGVTVRKGGKKTNVLHRDNLSNESKRYMLKQLDDMSEGAQRKFMAEQFKIMTGETPSEAANRMNLPITFNIL